MEKKELNPEYITMRDMALEQLKSGKSLTGKGGVFAPIIKEFLESALEAEMDVDKAVRFVPVNTELLRQRFRFK